MTDRSGFETAWLAKLSSALEKHAGEDVRKEVLDSGDPLPCPAGIVERISSLLDEATAEEILTSCACHYPHDQLTDVKERYRETGSVDEAISMLRSRFEAFLGDTLGLTPEEVTDVLSRGWGLAGVHQGDSIIATKIPKSGFLREYLHETDPEKRRKLYCHCPLVKEAAAGGEHVPLLYCYCGAGFYRDLWEEILQAPVRVEVIRSLFAGDDVCSFRLHLPGESTATNSDTQL